MIAIPLPAVELADARFSSINLTTTTSHAFESPQPPAPGSRTERIRVVSENWTDHKATLTFEGPAGATGGYLILRHRLLPTLKIDCPDVALNVANSKSRNIPCTSMIDTAHRDPNLPILMTPQLPPGEGWQTITVTLTW
jgi:hypothetical protein